MANGSSYGARPISSFHDGFRYRMLLQHCIECLLVPLTILSSARQTKTDASMDAHAHEYSHAILSTEVGFRWCGAQVSDGVAVPRRRSSGMRGAMSPSSKNLLSDPPGAPALPQLAVTRSTVWHFEPASLQSQATCENKPHTFFLCIKNVKITSQLFILFFCIIVQSIRQILWEDPSKFKFTSWKFDVVIRGDFRLDTIG